tara:strand:- start:1641 stop:2996 length:1356 start_codon:yes stop_codon:yes gene_type:complete
MFKLFPITLTALLFVPGLLLAQRKDLELPLNFKDQDGPTVVFLVHGSFAGNETWPLLVEKKTTFASELKRAGGKRTTIHHFLWSGQNKHQSRLDAAENLAKEIEEFTTEDDRVVIIGHSHGGNVGLLAASKLSRPVELVVCLSTPHLYLVMEDVEGQEVPLPIYCPPENQKQIKNIVCITPDNDRVPDFWAEINGVNDDTAIDLTRSWRRAQQLILPKVSSPFHDLAERVGLTDEIVNLESRDTLIVTEHNITYRSDVSGVDMKHSVVHSCRMGYILGKLVRHGMNDRFAEYLKTIYQQSPADDGAAINPEVVELTRKKHYDKIKHPQAQVALQITAVELEVELGAALAFGDEAKPDLYFVISSIDDEELFEVDEADDALKAEWGTDAFDKLLPVLSTGKIQVWDDDTFSDDPIGDPLVFTLSFKPNQFERKTTIKTDHYSITIHWQRLHE